MANYYCNKCNAEIKSTDTYCHNCGSKLSEVGRAIKLEIIETIGLNDKPRLSNAISSSFVNISGSIATASSIIKAIPEENLKEIGFEQPIIDGFNSLEKQMIEIQETLKKQSSYVKFDNCIFNASVNTTKEGNNIIITTDIDESFNRVYEEIERLSDAEVKKAGKAKTKELQEEVKKEQPNVQSIRDKLKDLRTLASLATLSQLAITIGKLIIGVN